MLEAVLADTSAEEHAAATRGLAKEAAAVLGALGDAVEELCARVEALECGPSPLPSSPNLANPPTPGTPATPPTPPSPAPAEE